MIVYKITNTVNNKVYIGATTISIKRRKMVHLSLSKKTGKSPINIAIRKYGKDNFKFQIIECVPDKETLYNREQYYVALYDSMNNGYNSTTGGIHYEASEEFKQNLRKVNLNIKPSAETRLKMSEAQRGEKNHNFGKRPSKETCRRMSEAKKKQSK